MIQTSYCIACKDVSGGQLLWLGGLDDGSGMHWCDLEAGLPGPGTMEYWSIIPLPGTDACYLWNDNANMYACFTPDDHRISLRALDVYDPSFIIKLDDVGDGWVAINNSAKDNVFTAQDAANGGAVIQYPWAAGDRQRWKLVDSNIIQALAAQTTA